MRIQTVLSMILALGMPAISSAQTEQFPPPIVQDLLAVKGSFKPTSKTAIKWAVDSDQLILSPMVIDGNSGLKAEKSPDGRCDAIISTYQTKDWTFTIRHTFWVWVAEVTTRDSQNKETLDEFLARILNDERSVKDLNESPHVAAEVNEITKDLEDKRLKLKVAGQFALQNQEPEGGPSDVYKVVGAENLTNHWLRYLRIARVNSGYVLWTLSLDGYPRSVPVNYFYGRNADFFKYCEKIDNLIAK